MNNFNDPIGKQMTRAKTQRAPRKSEILNPKLETNSNDTKHKVRDKRVSDFEFLIGVAGEDKNNFL
jgi:hypothetical protein